MRRSEESSGKTLEDYDGRSGLRESEEFWRACQRYADERRRERARDYAEQLAASRAILNRLSPSRQADEGA